MAEFIEAYWMQALWTILLSAATWFVRTIAKDIRTEKKEQDAIKEAVQSLNHDRIYEIFHAAFSRYNETGKGTTLEERRNMKYLFEGYKRLGGNGNGKDLYKKYMDLPVEESEELK